MKLLWLLLQMVCTTVMSHGLRVMSGGEKEIVTSNPDQSAKLFSLRSKVLPLRI